MRSIEARLAVRRFHLAIGAARASAGRPGSAIPARGGRRARARPSRTCRSARPWSSVATDWSGCVCTTRAGRALEPAQIDLDRLPGGAVEVDLERGGAHRERVAAVLAAPRRSAPGWRSRPSRRRRRARSPSRLRPRTGSSPSRARACPDRRTDGAAARAASSIRCAAARRRAPPPRPPLRGTPAPRSRGSTARSAAVGATTAIEPASDSVRPSRSTSSESARPRRSCPLAKRTPSRALHAAPLLAEVEALGLDLETARAADHHLALEPRLLRALVVDRALALDAVGDRRCAPSRSARLRGRPCRCDPTSARGRGSRTPPCRPW